MSSSESLLVSIETVADCIRVIRGQKVILDADLARLYGVTTTRLNQQVRRNLERFPDDFAFELSAEESGNLMLQNATSSSGHGGRRKPPLAFAEHGAVMAASVLNTPFAVQVSVHVVRAFVQLRQFLANHVELAGKLAEIERRVDSHDHQIIALIDTIRELMASPEENGRKIGFNQ